MNHIFRLCSILHKASIVALTICGIFTPTQAMNQKQISYLFAHGLGGDAQQCWHYQETAVILGTQNSPNLCDYHGSLCYTYNGPEVSGGQNNVVLAQEDDIEALYKGLESDNVRENLVGVGVSKGAATLINAVATGKFPTITALVLESPFCNANEVGYNVAYPLQYIPAGQNSVACAMESIVFPKYKSDGIQPITSAPNAPHIPILLFHSKQDALIPVNHSRKLYREFLKAGNQDVYLIETENGSHANILTNNVEQEHPGLQRTFMVIKIIQTFYKKYNLPYAELFYDKTIDLADYQPTLEEIEEKINVDEPGSFVSNIAHSSCSIFKGLFSSSQKT